MSSFCLYGYCQNLHDRILSLIIDIDKAQSLGLIETLGSALNRAIWCSYDMISPCDAFGQMMQRNLANAGYNVPGFVDFPTLKDHEERFLANGWRHSIAVNMLTVYNRLLSGEHRAEADKIERLDEVEEWSLLMSHYCLTTATNSELFSGEIVEFLSECFN